MDVADITAELTRIGESLQGSNKTRACLFNLILFTQKNARASYIHTLAQKVIERFPSRVIFITVDKENQDNTLTATVSVMAGATGEPASVCDLIALDATARSQEQIPFLLLSHLIPDLPVYVVWAEDPVVDNPLSHQIEKLATRIIFDSESTNDLYQFAHTLLRHKQQAGCDIADLNWARTENWRELIALTFYSTERLEQLKKAQTLTLTYNSKESPFFCHTQIQALYLQAWLASQLHWELQEIEGNTFYYTHTTVTLVEENHPALPPGTLISLDITTSDNLFFSFHRHKQVPEQVRMIFCDQEKCEIPSTYLFTKSHSALSLVGEICHNGTSEHYLTLLNFLKELNLPCLKSP